MFIFYLKELNTYNILFALQLCISLKSLRKRLLYLENKYIVYAFVNK